MNLVSRRLICYGLHSCSYVVRVQDKHVGKIKTMGFGPLLHESIRNGLGFQNDMLSGVIEGSLDLALHSKRNVQCAFFRTSNNYSNITISPNSPKQTIN